MEVEKWTVRKECNSTYFIELNHDKGIIAIFSDNPETTEKVAYRICRCVKSRDGLVELLKWAYGELTNTYEGLSLSAIEIPPQYQELQAALAEAEKEG